MSFSKRIIMEVPNTDYIIRVMKKADVEETAKLIVKAFNVPTEPITTFVNIDRTLYYDFIHFRLEHVVDQNYSLVAVDRKTGEIVGTLIVYDYKNTKPHDGMEKIIQSKENFQISDSFLDVMTIDFNKKCKEKNITKILSMPNGAVLEKARGNRLLKHFFELTLKNAHEKGFELVFAHFTNSFSSVVFLRMFKMAESWMDHYYDDFEYEIDKKITKPYSGCNEVALKYLRDNGLYKEKFGDDICKKCSLLVVDVKKQMTIEESNNQ